MWRITEELTAVGGLHQASSSCAAKPALQSPPHLPPNHHTPHNLLYLLCLTTHKSQLPYHLLQLIYHYDMICTHPNGHMEVVIYLIRKCTI